MDGGPAGLGTAIGAELLRAALLGAARPRVGEQYEILAVLGRGATGVAVRAWDSRLQRQVALKLVPSGSAPAAMLNEGRALAQLSRPRHVVQVYEVGQSEVRSASFAAPVDFVVMELLEGMSLRTWLATARPSFEAVVAMLAGVAAGLADVHARNIVHGDVKPDNVIVDRQGVPLLVDFAFAIPEAGRGGGAGAILGTAPYMAPEARRGNRRRAGDVFSFGVMAWEALTGAHPFGEREPRTDWLGILEELPGQRGLPVELKRILRRALHPSPGKRPSSAEIWEALGRVQPRRRRSRSVVVLGAAVAALLVCVGLLVGRPQVGRTIHRHTGWDPILYLSGCGEALPACSGFELKLRGENCRAPEFDVEGWCDDECRFVGTNRAVRGKNDVWRLEISDRENEVYELTKNGGDARFTLTRDGRTPCRGSFTYEPHGP